MIEPTSAVPGQPATAPTPPGAPAEEPAAVAEIETPAAPAEEATAAVPASRKVGVRAVETKTAARIILTWPEPVQFEHRVQGRELLLRFDRAFEAPGLADLPRRLPTWIESVSEGDETVLLRASREVSYRVSGEDSEVVVELLPSEPSLDRG